MQDLVDQAWLQHQLTADEAARFERDGYLVIPAALSAADRNRLSAAVERCCELVAERHGVPRSDRFNLLDIIGLDDAFFELIDHAATFPKVWGTLGWNIQISHSHLVVAPPLTASGKQRQHALHSHDRTRTRTITVSSPNGWWCWHRDGGQIKRDLGEVPQPRLSVKVAYYLSDALSDRDANMWVVPGSHAGPIKRLKASDGMPPGAQPIRVPAGDAILFDRRLIHSPSPNMGDQTRTVLFYGYSHRWIRPHDAMTVDPYLERAGPIRRQLLGFVNSPSGHISPRDEDVPLRGWLEAHGSP